MADKPALIALATEIVAAYVSNHTVPQEDIPGLIETVFASLQKIERESLGDPNMVRPVPAVPVSDSIHADYLICLEDGEKFKSLKRHLRTAYDMTPEEYRLKWGLPPDYPMVAPNYAQTRSDLAKRMGLGKKVGG